MNQNLEKYIDLYSRLEVFESEKIPLCAAETYISDFCKSPLNSNFEGKYSFIDSFGNNSFIGGEYVNQLNDLLKNECQTLFHAQYANADTITGINCFTICAMSLLTRGDYVLITTPEQGGHSSIPIILDTLGIKYETIPFNYSNYQIDYHSLNLLCLSNKFRFIIFCQSDVINPPDLSKIKLSHGMGIIYDGTQTLGLIAAKVIPNPLDVIPNVVLIGGAHKTLPAPACGLIMTNNTQYIECLKNSITPKFLRNTQPNHIAALLLSLIEQEEYGQEYQTSIVATANKLGRELENLNFRIAKLEIGVYTHTHQLFLLMNEKAATNFYQNAQQYNVTLNQKHKLLFSNDGIRLGVQEIARYKWSETEIALLAKLLYHLNVAKPDPEKILEIRQNLIAKKIPQFTYENIFIK